MSIAALFLIIALVLFVVDAFGVSARFNLQSAGLACVVIYLLIGANIL
jgi:hypothetical protein